jgi:hypothetical protein
MGRAQAPEQSALIRRPCVWATGSQVEPQISNLCSGVLDLQIVKFHYLHELRVSEQDVLPSEFASKAW